MTEIYSEQNFAITSYGTYKDSWDLEDFNAALVTVTRLISENYDASLFQNDANFETYAETILSRVLAEAESGLAVPNDMIKLAEQAIERNSENEKIPSKEWAANLAADLSKYND